MAKARVDHPVANARVESFVDFLQHNAICMNTTAKHDLLDIGVGGFSQIRIWSIISTRARPMEIAKVVSKSFDTVMRSWLAAFNGSGRPLFFSSLKKRSNSRQRQAVVFRLANMRIDENTRFVRGS